MGCDLGIPGNDIFGTIHIHHMNPISPSDIIHRNEDILDPEYLICVSTKTHNAIHYGDDDILDFGLIERKPYDTCPWKKGGK
jgi:predicted HNH restriction endonuclease